MGRRSREGIGGAFGIWRGLFLITVIIGSVCVRGFVGIREIGRRGEWGCRVRGSES